VEIQVSYRQAYLITAFSLGLMAIIATSRLSPDAWTFDSGLLECSAAGTSENKPVSPVSISSRPSSSPAASPTQHLPAKGCGATKSAGRGCRIEREEFFSNACAAKMPYYAFVPQESKEDCPVLYLLHGAFDSYTAWKDHAENIICELVSEYRVIIVTPEGGSFGWYADSQLVKNNQVETYFFNELIPDVQRKFHTNGRCSIAGLSMGGHGAFVLCLRHPGVFSSVSSMSGILDITRHKSQWRLTEVFGPYEGERVEDWEQHSAFILVERAGEEIRSLPMLITVSKDDQLSIDDNRLVHGQLDKMKVQHLYYESPGGHDWAYWTSQLPLHVSFHACWLKSIRPPADNPPIMKDAN
jgi:S-formylglutathione hydrolase FrmB